MPQTARRLQPLRIAPLMTLTLRRTGPLTMQVLHQKGRQMMLEFRTGLRKQREFRTALTRMQVLPQTGPLPMQVLNRKGPRMRLQGLRITPQTMRQACQTSPLTTLPVLQRALQTMLASRTGRRLVRHWKQQGHQTETQRMQACQKGCLWVPGRRKALQTTLAALQAGKLNSVVHQRGLHMFGAAISLLAKLWASRQEVQWYQDIQSCEWIGLAWQTMRAL